MSIGQQVRREKRQFHPRHVLVMMFGTAAILYAAAVYSMTPDQAPLPERHSAVTATATPEAYAPVRSLGYVVFDWPETDGTVPGFGPLTSDGQ